ncbi:hypothetical protein Tco_0576813 [Tanacetum coccineum]
MVWWRGWLRGGGRYRGWCDGVYDDDDDGGGGGSVVMMVMIMMMAAAVVGGVEMARGGAWYSGSDRSGDEKPFWFRPEFARKIAWIRRIGNWSNAFSCDVLALICRISLVGYGVLVNF